MAATTDRVGTAIGWMAVASVGLASAVAGLTDGVGIGAPSVPGPAWAPAVWWACYLAYVALFWTTDGAAPWSRRIPERAVPVALTGLGVAMSALAPALGWTSILLVVTAVVAAFVLEPVQVGLVVAVQTLATAVTGAVAGLDAVTVLLSVLAYGTFQAFAALLVVTAEREAAARTELAVAHAELRAATVLLAESSRSAERLRISRDLHDALGHRLTAVALELEIAAHEADGPVAEHLGRARVVAKELLADVRRTVGELRERRPSLGEALHDLVRDVRSPVVELAVDPGAVVTEQQLDAVVRCVQEALTNAIRHGDASRLEVTVVADAGEVRVETADDGRGTDLLSPGHGLTGMQERFAALGGRVEFATRAGQGFRTTGVLPS